MPNVIPFPPQPRPAAALPAGRRAGPPRFAPVDFLRVPRLPVLRRVAAAPVVPAPPARPSRLVTLRS